MRHPTTLTIFLLLSSLNFVLGQNPIQSKHEFDFYINDIKDSSVNTEISIIVSGDTIKSNKIGDFYYFPILDTANSFDMEIKVGNILFFGQGYKSWMLNKGTRIVLGKITQLNKLLSVAEYNGMTKKDDGWEWYSKRYFVADHAYTLDIDNLSNIKELEFIILNPNNSHSLITTQKIVR
ncbi:MAG: hypothetical protein KF862_14685 [Chitinophagaceae bacterium]|nr:hypothetical protein [Chitinophagaceae bacterium]